MDWSDEMLETIVFSDQSRCVLGDDETWVWYRAGEGNQPANVETVKFPRSLMVFAVIGIGYKSRLLVVPGTVEADRYKENCQNLGFIGELDEKFGQYQWVSTGRSPGAHREEDYRLA
jgi:hypothetical protein